LLSPFPVQPFYYTLLNCSSWEFTSTLEVSESVWVARVHVVNAYRKEVSRAAVVRVRLRLLGATVCLATVCLVVLGPGAASKGAHVPARAPVLPLLLPLLLEALKRLPTYVLRPFERRSATTSLVWSSDAAASMTACGSPSR